MRRIILTMVALVATSLAAFAGNDKPIKVNQLPAPAKQFIATYFADSKLSYAKMETESYGKTYEVVLRTGKKWSLTPKGNEKRSNANQRFLPRSFPNKSRSMCQQIIIMQKSSQLSVTNVITM